MVTLASPMSTAFMATTQFMDPAEAWKMSVTYTHKAYALNPQHAGVHYLLANLSFFTDCNYQDAFTHILRSVELKPSYPEAQQYLAFLYMLSGKMKKAHHHLQFALGIDPLNQETLFYKACFHYRKKETEKALTILTDLLDRNPKNLPALMVYLYSLLLQKKYRDMLHKIQNIPKDILIPQEQLGILTLIYILSNDKSKSTIYLKKLENEAKKILHFKHTRTFFWLMLIWG